MKRLNGRDTKKGKYMAGKGKADSFAQFAALKVIEAGANTLTAVKFAFPFSIMDKMALIISRIEYDWQAISAALAATNDRIVAAIACAPSVVDIEDVTDPLIIDSYRTSRYDLGTAAAGFYMRQPYVKDFSNLQGGGILVAPNPLYLMVEGQGAGAACACAVRMYYTYIELSSDEYWQLVESRRIISS